MALKTCNSHVVRHWSLCCGQDKKEVSVHVVHVNFVKIHALRNDPSEVKTIVHGKLARLFP